MVAHRHQSGEHHDAGESGSHAKALVLLVGAAVVAVGLTVVVFTGSLTSGVVFALLTGVCIVVAHLMISPGPVVRSTAGEHTPRRHRHRRALDFRMRAKHIAH